MSLQTQIALLATLLAFLACGVCELVGIVFFDLPTSTMGYMLIAIAIVFVLGLIIGHFLIEPLNSLATRMRTYTEDDRFIPAKHTGRGGMEYRALSEQFDQLVEANDAHRADFERVESRRDEYMSDLSHELRTPLTSILGTAEMLKDPDLSPAMHERFCNTIIRESERLTRMTKDLLSLQTIREDARPQDMHRVDLRKLAQEVADSLEPLLIERKANLEVTGEAPDVLGDSDRLRQVISNLVDNASRFIDPGGHIEIALSGLHGKSVIAVKDDGCGFGEADPKLLFSRFYRSDQSRCRNTGGTGLGLSIVKEIVEEHDGTVEAFNRPGGGACFLVAIPSIQG